jgi:hypothetical protein
VELIRVQCAVKNLSDATKCLWHIKAHPKVYLMVSPESVEVVDHPELFALDFVLAVEDLVDVPVMKGYLDRFYKQSFIEGAQASDLMTVVDQGLVDGIKNA